MFSLKTPLCILLKKYKEKELLWDVYREYDMLSFINFVTPRVSHMNKSVVLMIY